MKYFALTNDIDHSKVTDLKNIFNEFNKKNIKITISIFSTLKTHSNKLCEHCNISDTNSLDEKDFVNFLKDQIDIGHEIAYHGFSQSNDYREEFIKGISIIEDKIGITPKIYIEHGGHSLSHSMDMVANQNLSLFGKIKESNYYVKDIIESKFNLITTHEEINYDPKFMSYDQVFKQGKIKKFIRTPLHIFKNLNFKNIKDGEMFIGYTHFGYTGYKSKFLIKNLFNKTFSLEWWTSKKEIRDNVKLIYNHLIENDIKSVTVSDLYNRTKV